MRFQAVGDRPHFPEKVPVFVDCTTHRTSKEDLRLARFGPWILHQPQPSIGRPTSRIGTSQPHAWTSHRRTKITAVADWPRVGPFSGCPSLLFQGSFSDAPSCAKIAANFSNCSGALIKVLQYRATPLVTAAPSIEDHKDGQKRLAV